MSMPANDFPAYFDGSSSIEFAEELAIDASILDEESDSEEEWRRYISANPYF